MGLGRTRQLPPDLPRPPRTPPTARPGGPLRPAVGQQYFDLGSVPAPPELDPWVERYWSVRWDLPAGTSYDSTVLTHPAVHLTVESGHGPRHGYAMPATLVHGVVTRTFTATLESSGRVFGAKFRPGGYAAFLGSSIAECTDTVQPLGGQLGAGADELQSEILLSATDLECSVVMNEFLVDRRPDPDPRYEELLRVVADMTADRSLVTVDAVAERHGTSVRALQRLFRHYVGVSPKWVLQRFRLQDAARLIDAGGALDLAALAADLGWYDQSHFTRDFGEVVGMPPAAYAAAARG